MKASNVATNGNRETRVPRWVVSAILALMMPVVGWAVWITTEVMTIRYETRFRTIDRFSADMFIDVQQQLKELNPDMTWLNARQIREIQKRHPPYNNGIH